MNDQPHRPPSFWTTVWLLLGVARRRSQGRRTRQQELLNRRSASNWSSLGFAFFVMLMGILNGLAAFVVQSAVETGQRISMERRGVIVVRQSFLTSLSSARQLAQERSVPVDEMLYHGFYSYEASSIVEHEGGDKNEIEKKLHDAVLNHPNDLVPREVASPGLSMLVRSGPLAPMLGSAVLLIWVMMLVFQGEGLELDLQRRRHPMWEWIFSHPVPAGAVFLAEMLSPIAANPMYWTAPLFVGFLYGLTYDAGYGLLAAVLIGVPVTLAAACLGKALEIATILRSPPRTRGAIVGMMSWLGYSSMMLFFFGIYLIPRVGILGRLLDGMAALPWPWLKLFLGARTNGSFLFVSGLMTCWAAVAITLVGAVWFSVWGAKQGLSGNFATADAGPSVGRKGPVRFGREPLYRKEFLWFVRDRSAIVQTILIPVTVASLQLFNFRHFLSGATSAWNYLCGVAIMFGTYFLWILGPKSLTSEGSALWIALTWPRGLESLLKAKAWLWSMISTGMVALILGYAAVLYPAKIGAIALVGIGWFLFGNSMAEKTVTLVTVTSSSGEREPLPKGRRWAAQLGMLTFAIGVLSQRWHIAIMGIVYSYMTAAAMWQNFRARLPYLYDPWSEETPQPPTLMHAMIAISILVEGGAVVTGLVLVIAGRENIAVAQAISYGICAVVVSIGTQIFLSERNVLPSDVWYWPAPLPPDGEPEPLGRRAWQSASKNVPLLLLGAGMGAALGLFAAGYLAVLHHIPATAEILRKSEEALAKIPDLKISYAVMAVGFAPFAEEYLFRGLLFRALDREWGGWRAVVGSAAFFAVYHPPLAWIPVFLLGASNAMLFKKTGRLAPAVMLHMIYNAVVVLR